MIERKGARLGHGAMPVEHRTDPAREDDWRCDAVLDPLIGAISASGSILSRHARGDPNGRLLSASGDVVGDDDASSMMAHAHACSMREFSDGDRLGEGVWLSDKGAAGAPMLTVMFRSRDQRSRIIFTARFGGKGPPERKLVTATLRRLAPSLEAYCQLWERARVEVQRNRGMREALDLIDLGVVLLDRDGGPCFVNAAAEALLAEKRFIRVRGTGLQANSLAGTLRLQAAIATAVTSNEESGGGDALSAQESTLLRLTDGHDHLIVAALPASHPAEDADAVAAMLILLTAEGDAEKVVVPACRLFGLSGVETRLACHLVAGRSVSEASLAMRIREATSRGYLKQIFAKTRVNRQADLVRVLLSSIVRARTGGTIQVI